MDDDVEITPEMEQKLGKAYRYLPERRQQRLSHEEKPAQFHASSQGGIMEATSMQS